MPKLFLGKEVEGIHRGLSTLFIEGSVPIDKILQVLTEQQVDQVYFGAVWQGKGEPSEISWPDVQTIAVKFHHIRVTVDVIRVTSGIIDIIKASSNMNLLLTYNRKAVSRLKGPLVNVQIKFVGEGEVFVCPLAQFTVNQMNEADPDVLIWEG